MLSSDLMMMKWSESYSVMSDSLRPHGLYSPWNSPGQNTGVGSFSLPQGIFPTQESNPGLLHCRKIFFTSWGTREAQVYWSGYPIHFPADLPDTGIKTGSPALQVDSLLTELSGKPLWWWWAQRSYQQGQHCFGPSTLVKRQSRRQMKHCRPRKPFCSSHTSGPSDTGLCQFWFVPWFVLQVLLKLGGERTMLKYT